MAPAGSLAHVAGESPFPGDTPVAVAIAPLPDQAVDGCAAAVDAAVLVACDVGGATALLKSPLPGGPAVAVGLRPRDVPYGSPVLGCAPSLPTERPVDPAAASSVAAAVAHVPCCE